MVHGEMQLNRDGEHGILSRKTGYYLAPGLEVDSNLRFNQHWSISAGYILANATVISFPSNPFIEGLLIPQTPRHSFTIQATYASPRHYRLGLQGRASGSQFEDDQNLLPLRSFFTFDVYVLRFFARWTEVFIAGENLLNSRYEVGRAPVVTVGPPAQVRVGLKLNFGRESYRIDSHPEGARIKWDQY